jgi:hypothetical protein
MTFVLWPASRNDRLSNLFCIIHPSTQFLSSVSANGFDLIFVTMIVIHVFLPRLVSSSKFPQIHTCFAIRLQRVQKSSWAGCESNPYPPESVAAT